MKTKEFNSIIVGLTHREITAKKHDDFQLYSGKYVITLTIDCDINVDYYRSSTHFDPEEFELSETKLITDIKVTLGDDDKLIPLNDIQFEKLAQEIDDNLKVVY
jgi:hypothetical protein